LTVCAGILSANLAFAGSPKISKDLEGIGPSQQIDVIVQFNRAPTGEQLQRVLALGGTLKQQHGLIKGAAYSISVSALADLAADPNVAYISPDRPVTSTASGDDSTTLDYYLPALNAQYASSLGYDGSGIGVAVIDSGITDIPDLHGHDYRVIYAQDFTGSNATVDQYAHGTHVAGIIGGNGKNSTGSNYSYTIRGLAPNVNLINLRVLDANGAGSDSAVIEAIETAINLKSKYNIRVINLSLGRAVFESYQQDPLCQAVEQAYHAGIVVVVAAGNGGRDNSHGTNGYGTITAPGNDPYVITVGAMKTMGTPSRADDLIATYSSKGPTLFDHVVKPDLVAPGNRIVSLYTAGLTLPKNYPGNASPYSLYQVNGNSTASSTYYRLSGTSMAAPMVSGTVALMLQQNPGLTPDQVKARLMKTASKTFPTYSS
jgi:serine protease AprX